MATEAQIPGLPSRRRDRRYRMQAPVDVTVLRSGIPDTVPGRSLNLGEGGVAAVLAEELSEGETVAVQMNLPTAGGPLRLRATVRHHDRLRSGMEFVGLSRIQKEAIRDWSATAPAEERAGRGAIPVARQAAVKIGEVRVQPPRKARRVWKWIALVVAAIVALGILWWRWNLGWRDLEAGLPQAAEASAKPEVRVPAEAMQKLLIHRVDPDYPESARAAKLSGVIALDVVVGRNGSVLRVHPLNGPAVLAQAAVEALRWWRFEPYLVNGKDAVVETTIAVEFKP